jgi:hypothetical protein
MRRIRSFERQHGKRVLHLACHAALPVAINAELMHLLRINFFLDPPEPLPFTAEFDVLLASFCHEVDIGLYEIDPSVRNVLLKELGDTYDREHLQVVASLLWQYSRRYSPWADRPNLDYAQQLTALNILEPVLAREWLERAEIKSGSEAPVDRNWFVAMRHELNQVQDIRQKVKTSGLLRKPFDPRKFIDREFEQELFEELLAFQDAARILAIRDVSGMGKSHLLALFRYRCRVTRPRTPVSLIDLRLLPDQSPMLFVKAVVEDLVALDVPFPEFNRYESARVSADFDFFRGSVYLQGASFKDARDIRRMELTGEQREKAEDVCVRSFLTDVRAYCAEQPIVLLIDSFERCNERLRAWLREHFLEPYFFDPAKRPAKLLLVVAGQTVPDFTGNWSIEECERTVKLVDGLSRWTREHVEQCLMVQGFRYEEQDIDSFYRLVELGLPPSQVTQAIETVLSQKGTV